MMMEVGFTSLSFPTHSSTKIKLIFVILALFYETCTHAADTEQISSNLGEVMDEIGNPSDTDASPSQLDDAMSIEDQNDRMMYKRHMGAIAALSGSRQLTGSKSFISPSKKHIGSIASAAAQSMGRTPTGRKLELIFPTKVELYKRHLGSLMALSGSKPRPYRRSLKEPLSGKRMDSQAGAFELETLPMSFAGLDVVGRNGVLSDADIMIPDEIQSAAVAGSLSDYADELSSENEFQHMNNNEILDQNVASTELNGDDVGASKSKRFLGPLARGGWFPRHFRGIVSENTFGKRHIGALARLGWMPHAKGNSRLGLALGDQRGEIGLKRNDALTRRRMLYHFTAPSLWTSPRGK